MDDRAFINSAGDVTADVKSLLSTRQKILSAVSAAHFDANIAIPRQTVQN